MSDWLDLVLQRAYRQFLALLPMHYTARPGGSGRWSAEAVETLGGWDY